MYLNHTLFCLLHHTHQKLILQTDGDSTVHKEEVNKYYKCCLDKLTKHVVEIILLIKILLFFNHWSNHLFQSNQCFQAIEIMNCPVPEKLDIFYINISWAFYAWLLSCHHSYPKVPRTPLGTPGTPFWCAHAKICLHFLSLTAKASEINNNNNYY